MTSELALNRLSDNVGGVKYFLSALLLALGRARHFALVEDVPNPRLARNRFQVRNSVPTAIMITTSNSPVKGSGMPNQLLGV